MKNCKKKDSTWDIGEFVSYQLTEDKNNGEFQIILKGDIKYADFFANKIGNLKIKKSELESSMKKFIAYTKEDPPTRIEIKEDTNVGFYIYITPANFSGEDKDYLQDTLDAAFEFVEEEYGIKRTDWQKIEGSD